MTRERCSKALTTNERFFLKVAVIDSAMFNALCKVHLVMQAVTSSHSHVALQTSLDGKLLPLFSSATVVPSAGQNSSGGLLTFLINAVDVCEESNIVAVSVASHDENLTSNLELSQMIVLIPDPGTSLY